MDLLLGGVRRHLGMEAPGLKAAGRKGFGIPAFPACLGEMIETFIRFGEQFRQAHRILLYPHFGKAGETVSDLDQAVWRIPSAMRRVRSICANGPGTELAVTIRAPSSVSARSLWPAKRPWTARQMGCSIPF